MRDLPSSSALAAFEAAARHGSFLAAAGELHVTPGAISRQVRALERFLGTILFARQHRQVTLNEAGRRYLAAIQAPLREVERASQALRRRERPAGISICAYPTFAIRWLIPRWGALADAYPGIDLRLTTSLDAADFDQAGYDFAIQVLPEKARRRGFRIEKLLDVDTFPVASPAVAARLDGPAALAAQTLLHGAPRPADWQNWLDAAGIDDVDPAAGLTFESTNLAIHAAIEGLGVAIGVEALIRDDLRSGRLVRLFGTGRRSRHPFQLVHPVAKAGDPLLQSVRRWLLAEAARDSAASGQA
ncbi:MAG: LysR substrate-binding domain-containing protein [Sneathiellaceae bacterium]